MVVHIGTSVFPGSLPTRGPGGRPLTAAAAQALEPDDRTKDARQALDAMEQATKAMRGSAKADARQRLERIKRQIQILRQFNSDPKAIARQVAQLARELGAAVKAYAGASGGGVGVSADEAGVSADQTGASVDEAQAENGLNAAAAETAQDGFEPAARDAASVAATASDEKAGGTADPDASASTIREEVARLSAEIAQRDGEAKADQDFMNEARQLLDQIKALLRAARDKAGRADPEVENAVKAAKEAAAEIDEAGSALVGGVDLTV